MKKVILDKLLQRLLFLIALLFLWGSLYDRIFVYGSSNILSSLGLSYGFILWVGTAILLFHIFFLSVFSWISTFIFYLLIASTYSKRLIKDYINYHGSLMKDYMNTNESLVQVVLIIVVMATIPVLLWKLKPKSILHM